MHSVQRRSGIRGNYTAMSRELAVCVSPRVPALRVTYIAYRHTEPYTVQCTSNRVCTEVLQHGNCLFCSVLFSHDCYQMSLP